MLLHANSHDVEDARGQRGSMPDSSRPRVDCETRHLLAYSRVGQLSPAAVNGGWQGGGGRMPAEAPGAAVAWTCKGVHCCSAVVGCKRWKWCSSSAPLRAGRRRLVPAVQRRCHDGPAGQPSAAQGPPFFFSARCWWVSWVAVGYLPPSAVPLRGASVASAGACVVATASMRTVFACGCLAHLQQDRLSRASMRRGWRWTCIRGVFRGLGEVVSFSAVCARRVMGESSVYECMHGCGV